MLVSSTRPIGSPIPRRYMHNRQKPRERVNNEHVEVRITYVSALRASIFKID